jgi:hypothetical protein
VSGQRPRVDELVYPQVELVRDDLADLATKAAKELVEAEEAELRRQAIEGMPETPTETYGVLVRRLPCQAEWYEGEVIGLLPGSREITKVTARTVEGTLAMCHRRYLAILTGSGVDAAKARIQAAEANFYVASVLGR